MLLNTDIFFSVATLIICIFHVSLANRNLDCNYIFFLIFFLSDTDLILNITQNVNAQILIKISF